MRILRFNNELTRWDTAAIDEVKRRTLDTKNYGLKFGPVSAEDSGTYLCLINNRREPDALLELTVEGKIRDIHIECSKHFKCKLYFYRSGQRGPFWAELKLL